ncbi:MAG: glutamate--cysteine ligase [Pseudobdellovibrionaceae bacterium]
MSQTILHQQTLKNMDVLCEWFQKKSLQVQYPIYSSYDIRDAGYKITNVDANIYPAGFNNICPVDKESSVDLAKEYIHNHYGSQVKKIVLITEEHTNNPYYWDNIFSLQKMFVQAGMDIKLAMPKNFTEPLQLQSATGQILTVYSAGEETDFLKNENPDLIVSNNDFSLAYENWGQSLHWPMTPPRELGWYQRKKSRYFKHYNNLVNEFANLAQIDPFLMRVETEVFEDFDLSDDHSRNFLAEKVDQMLIQLKSEYEKRNIEQKPFVFVKNNSGTYGLAVIRVGSAEEVRSWTYKSRKKMKAAKGGMDVEQVIIQEGIPSVVQSDGASAEPVIYMLGKNLAGGFLRTHSEKNSEESLNSPGAVYKRLCVSDLAVDAKGCPLENVYGWSAKLGLLAIGLEADEMKVEFKGYKRA